MLKTIYLDPKHCPGQKLRYTSAGWGLISIQLYGREHPRILGSPRIPPPEPMRGLRHIRHGLHETAGTGAIESHTHRLQRILRKITYLALERGRER